MARYELYRRIKRNIYWRAFGLLFGGDFKKFGRRVRITSPLKIEGAKCIEIGDRTIINDLGWLMAVPIDDHEPLLTIGQDTYIGHMAHIVCVRRVHIGNNVITADRIYISDNIHGYEDIETPVIRQKVQFKSEASVGDDSWLGENVCIVGARIGKHCVIGANSVVTRDIPDYSIAVGMPARVIKKYNFETRRWESTTQKEAVR